MTKQKKELELLSNLLMKNKDKIAIVDGSNTFLLNDTVLCIQDEALLLLCEKVRK